jgi:hypothetical protein
VGKGLVLGDTPAERDRIADKGDAADPGFGRLRDLRRTEAEGVGLHRHSHEPRFGLLAMAMTELWPNIADLDFARILPHLKLVELAIVEDQACEAFQGQQTQHRNAENQQGILAGGFH